MKDAFKIASEMVSYVLGIELYQIPLHIFYVAICFAIAYCGSLIMIGFPCSVFEAITKRKVNGDIENKVISKLSISLGIGLLIRLLYELSTR